LRFLTLEDFGIKKQSKHCQTRHLFDVFIDKKLQQLKASTVWLKTQPVETPMMVI
jgi:hypothetical protein